MVYIGFKQNQISSYVIFSLGCVMKLKKLSLHQAIASLVSSSPKVVYPPDIEQMERAANTIRFDPDLRIWIEAQAKHLSISVQDFVNLTMKGVRASSEQPAVDQLDLSVMRFFSLFHDQNISTIDIPRLLPKGLISASDLNKSDKVLNMLSDPDVRENLSELFGVTNSWLKGESVNAYTPKSFYKDLGHICLQISRHKVNVGDYPIVYFVFPPNIYLEELVSETKNEDRISFKVIVAYPLKKNNVRYVKYEVWDTLDYTYFRTRDFAKGLVYFCDRLDVELKSVTAIKRETYDAVSNHEELLNQSLNCRSNWGATWYIDELVADRDINPQREKIDEVKSFFREQGCEKYMRAATHPQDIVNRQSFIESAETPIF